MSSATRHRLVISVLAVLGAVAGLLVAVIVTLNLHILVGLEQGYAASPAEVFEHSVLLGVFDIVLLIGAPVIGIVLMTSLRRRGDGSGVDDR